MRPVVRCRCCDRQRSHEAHGWCKPCYDRWLYQGRPEDGPSPPWAGRLGRVEDYAWLRFEQGHSRTQAAERLGVTERSAERYEAVLRERAAGQEVA